MARHNVDFELPTRELGKVDAIFHIYRDEILLGTMRISKGGLDYSPANKKIPIKMNWTQFDAMTKKWNDG